MSGNRERLKEIRKNYSWRFTEKTRGIGVDIQTEMILIIAEELIKINSYLENERLSKLNKPKR